MLKVVNQGTHVPVVDVVDGVATVESTNIAEVFEKRHDHVLRDIENILISLPSERRDNFIEIQLDRRESRKIQVGLHRRIQPAADSS